ncbi:hypothetical protein [Actinomadura rubrisoli]|uniref:Uncharacterized protein n=1 Tax=Actinomadura rubrisoli TaxID=2530368 RepID=A0A4R5A8R7_9ACTN|nr:hypothetical protein [Actinomadura rubrisoli]TDD68573.1 hypothetical protein E1298_38225 [Actinomadura rubrisoli]
MPPTVRFVPYRVNTPHGAPVRLDFHPDGLIVVRVHPKLNLTDVCDTFTWYGTRIMNSRLWSHRTAAGPLSVLYTTDDTLPRDQPVEYDGEDGPATVRLRADLDLDEALGRLMPMLSAGMNEFWNLAPSRLGTWCRICGAPLDENGVCFVC